MCMQMDERWTAWYEEIHLHAPINKKAKVVVVKRQGSHADKKAVYVIPHQILREVQGHVGHRDMAALSFIGASVAIGPSTQLLCSNGGLLKQLWGLGALPKTHKSVRICTIPIFTLAVSRFDMASIFGTSVAQLVNAKPPATQAPSSSRSVSRSPNGMHARQLMRTCPLELSPPVELQRCCEDLCYPLDEEFPATLLTETQDYDQRMSGRQ